MSALRQAAETYMSVEPDQEYVEKIRSILDNEEELKKYFGSRLTFGTAGIRGVTGPGYTGINQGIIIQTAQGYCQYLIDTLGIEECKARGIVIGYDARRGSRDYAEITSNIFLMKGIKVYLFSTIIPTPFVSFACRHYNCCGAVMVTASHNPATDNGYKVYWGNGAQIVSPHDEGIKNSIAKNLNKWEGYDSSLFATSPLCKDPLDEVMEAYMDLIYKNLCFHHDENSQPSGLKITYSAMHGVGFRPTFAAYKKFGLPLPIPVPNQIEGNGDFPTCAFPNPEEGEKVFRLAFKVADAHGSDLIICQDPDADRVGLAERLPDGTWKIFHGNHTGALLTWWQMKHFKGDRSKAIFHSSTVSTQLQGVMARKEGFQHKETLTGFKWLGNSSLECQEKGIKPLLAFEEAIGFGLLPGYIPDKDAISAAATVGEMAHYLRRHEHKTLLQKLDEIYAEYGYFLFNNSFFICHDQPLINSLFERMRTSGPNNSYVDHIGEFKIAGIRDMTNHYDSRTEDKHPILPKQGGQMITFYLENGCVATIRTSGTEPKIKWYIEIGASNQEKATHDLAEVVEAIQADLLQRDKYHFKSTE